MTTDPDPAALHALAEEALRLSEKATPGPWEPNVLIDTHGSCAAGFPFAAVYRGRRSFHANEPADQQDADDIHWIVCARTSLPALAAAYLRLDAYITAECARYGEVADELATRCGCRFDDNGDEVVKCALHDSMRRERDEARAQLAALEKTKKEPHVAEDAGGVA